MTRRFDSIYNGLMLGESETYDGIREISALEPLPGDVGFIRVSSTRVQSSPLKPQFPERGGSLVSPNNILVNGRKIPSTYQSEGSCRYRVDISAQDVALSVQETWH